MKKQSLRIFLIFSVLAILAVSSAQAQSSLEQTAHIPFSFNVGNRTFPAGEYRVTRVNPSSDKAALLIKSMDDRISRIVLTTRVQADRTQEGAKLLFKRYGDKYFLSSLWTPADATGLELPRTRAENMLARNTAKEEQERLTVALNSRRR